MPTVTLNKTVFEELVGKELSLEELKERISMLGTDLEGIEGEEIHVEIFPNRPDMLSEQGFARAFSSFIGVKTGLKEYKVASSGEKVIIENSVQGVRPYTACAIIKNLELNEEKIREIIQIQEKLHVTYGRNRKKAAIGVYPLEKIKFPVTYKADLPENIKFQPLEADGVMSATDILENNKTGQEFAHLLEGMEKYPFFIDSAKEILSMPPIINSNLTGRVTPESKDLFVECSGHNFQTLSTCLNIIVAALADMGGEIYSVDLEYESGNKTTPNLTPEKMKLDLSYVNKILGLKLDQEKVKELLAKMGFGVSGEEVLIPAYRADILHPIDLVEDIAIAYGYENFEEEIPQVATIGEEAKSTKLMSKVREILIGLRLIEVTNFHLMTQEDLATKMNLETETVALKNSIGEHNHLRDSILASLMKNLSENQHHEYPQNIFEIGKTFSLADNETGVKETEKLGIVLCHEKTDFTEVRQVLATLFSSLGLEVEVKEIDHSSFIKGRAGEIVINGNKIGVIGEFQPQVILNWDFMMPVVGLELDLEKVFDLI